MPTAIRTFQFSSGESKGLTEHIENLFLGAESISIAAGLDAAYALGRTLPVALIDELRYFRLRGGYPGIVVSTDCKFSVEDPPTPALFPKSETLTMSRKDVAHLAISSVVGDAFGWTRVQNGSLINDVFPIRENRQLPISSNADLFDLHTEDASSPFPADYLSLQCIRNEEQSGTLLSFFDDYELSDATLSLLLSRKIAVPANLLSTSSKRALMKSVLFGDPVSPYICFNCNNLNLNEIAQDLRAACEELIIQAKKHSFELHLASNDILILDNLKVLHGRSAYEPRYDGRGRWLKRIYLTRDLRKYALLKDPARRNRIFDVDAWIL
jgi:hypothetical protein